MQLLVVSLPLLSYDLVDCVRANYCSSLLLLASAFVLGPQTVAIGVSVIYVLETACKQLVVSAVYVLGTACKLLVFSLPSGCLC